MKRMMNLNRLLLNRSKQVSATHARMQNAFLAAAPSIGTRLCWRTNAPTSQFILNAGVSASLAELTLVCALICFSLVTIVVLARCENWCLMARRWFDPQGLMGGAALCTGRSAVLIPWMLLRRNIDPLHLVSVAQVL
ncbi:MAG: hypothetical protein RSD57_00615 [Comamonas sp.]